MQPRRPRAANHRRRPLRAAGLLVIAAIAAGAGVPRDDGLLSTPTLPEPVYAASFTDPAFGTTIHRVTEPGRVLSPGVRCAKGVCRHRYSSTQAWNADQSLVLIDKGCSDLCFLDGQSFAPLFMRQTRKDHDCKWHPRDPEAMVCVRSDAVDLWRPRANTWRTLYEPSARSRLEFGPYKGNISEDGRRIAVRAIDSGAGLVAFVLELDSGRPLPAFSLGSLEGTNQHVLISASGRYVIVAQRTEDGHEPTYVFTSEGKLVQHWPEHHRPGHGDVAIDVDGEDIYVGVSKSWPDEFRVIKRRLRDGVVTALLPHGDAGHVSARNTGHPGWVFVSFAGTFEHTRDMAYPAPFYSEIVAVRLDGAAVRRIAHARAAPHDYLAEIHASPSPDGARVIFASNWGRAGGPVSSYVAEIEPPLGSDVAATAIPR